MNNAFVPVIFADATELAAPAAATETVPAAPGAETAAAEGAPSAPAARPQQSGFGMMLPLLVLFGIFYFMMIRPQQRKERERQKTIDSLRAGAKVVFAGGLIGTIVEAKEKTFLIEVASGTAIEVVRGAVQGLADEAQAK